MSADIPEGVRPSPVRVAALGAEILDAVMVSRRLAALAASSASAQADRTAGVLDALTRIADAAQAMAEVALQTRLLAFNLSVEATRRDASADSLGLMARAVTDLSGRVEAASRQIVDIARRFDAHLSGDVQARGADGSPQAGVGPAIEALQDALDRILAGASELRSTR
jgi:methyl-accepting chemotaxis protein